MLRMFVHSLSKYLLIITYDPGARNISVKNRQKILISQSLLSGGRETDDT